MSFQKSIKIAILLLIGLSLNNAVYSQEKIILTTHNLYPYGSYDKGKEVKKIADRTFSGAAVDVVRCTLLKMKVPFEIHVVPWNRAQMLVKSYNAQGFFAGSQKKSRDEFAVMSEIIADQKWVWYLLKANPHSPENSDFKKKATVAGFRGSNMLSWMKENGYNVKTTPIDTSSLLKLLLAKRVDAVMANNYVMEAIMKEQGVTDKVKSYVNKNKPLGVYFSKKFVEKRPKFLKEFNRLVPGCRLEAQ